MIIVHYHPLGGLTVRAMSLYSTAMEVEANYDSTSQKTSDQSLNESNIEPIHNMSTEIKNKRKSNAISEHNDENTATENWCRKNKRKIKSYMSPNPHLKYLDLQSKKINRSLPILKNGSRAEDLKALQIKGYCKIVLTNTCAFDTAVFLFMVATYV